jgi:circadian clock protein KaiC
LATRIISSSAPQRNRGLYIIKSRGISHSNKIRELLLTDAGMELEDVYFGPDGTLTGTARIQQESREQDQIVEFQQQVDRKRSEFEHKRQMTEARMAIMRAQLEAEEKALALQIQEHESKMTRAAKDRKVMARQRTAESLE